jgi:DNA-binding MarR family transcriptional regulator
MLDWGHRLVLRSVSKGGHTRPSPALTNLEAAGLVRASDNERTYELTDEGRAALAASKSTKLERVGWPIVWICLFIVALASVIELLS